MLVKSLLGGGILLFTILSLIPTHTYATELRTLCTNGTCTIDKPESKITNSSPFSTTNTISIQTTITDFINYSTIQASKIEVKTNGNFITNFYNYGRIEMTNGSQSLETSSLFNSGYKNIYNYGHISGFIYLGANEGGTTHITNYGTMRGVQQATNNSGSTKTIIIDNRGTINLLKDNGTEPHFQGFKNLVIENYAIKVDKEASAFNSFNGSGRDNSHLILSNNQISVSFADKGAKIILDFGARFQEGVGYSLDKLIVDNSGVNQLKMGIDRLIPRNDIFYITQSGEKFFVNLKPESSTIGNLYKANVRAMNNFMTISNSMIYPHKKVNANRAVKRKKMIRRVKKVSSLRGSIADEAIYNPSLRDSIQSDSSVFFSSLRVLAERQGEAIHESLDSTESFQSLESHESPLFRHSEGAIATEESKNPYIALDSSLISFAQNDTFFYKTDSTNRRKVSSNQTTNRQMSQAIPSTQSDKYHFILTPFVNHNLFFESGRYNLSGFDGGFLTAFSGKITANNSLGTHFMMSYGTLGDSSDKNFHISNLNLNLGLNYKFDLIWDMYVKARGDFFYFLNQVKTLTMMEAIKPNNLGFGLSVAYGKDFDFKQGGVLGLEAGLDYRALKSNNINFDSQSYQQALYNLIYADVGVNYAKYFRGFGINLGGGFKANLAPKLAKVTLLAHSQNRSFVLDNDKYLGYANVGLNYVLNARNFDMEFSLAYYGNYGDRVISNGGGFEWRVSW